MTFQGETLFALVRRRESIRALAQQKSSLLPSSLIPKEEKSVTSSLATSAQQLQKDLLILEKKKKIHLAVSKHRGGKKLNRLSYIGLFIGLLILGSLFFIAGYLMSLSLNPSYGGIIFNPKYGTVSPGQPLSADRRSDRIEETEDISVRPDVPRKSYVDRQALIARTSNQPEKKGLLEKAEERTFNNVKNQVKDTVVQGVRNLSQKLGNRLGSSLNNMVSPITQNLPQDLASDSLNKTFDQLSSKENHTGFTSQQDAADHQTQNETVSKTTIDGLSSEKNTVQSKDAIVDSEDSVLSTSSSGSNLYAIRIHRFAERDTALKLAEELRRKGYDGYIIPVWDEKGHLDFEVRSGSYATYLEAQSALKVLQQIWHDPGVELPGVVMIRRNEEQIRP